MIVGHATFTLDGDEVDAPQARSSSSATRRCGAPRSRSRRARPCSRSAASRARIPRRPGSGTSRPSITARAGDYGAALELLARGRRRGSPTMRASSTRRLLGGPGGKHRGCDRGAAGGVRARPACRRVGAKDDADLDAIRGLAGLAQSDALDGRRRVQCLARPLTRDMRRTRRRDAAALRAATAGR